jgi:ABC-type dipeptide/oligopeptide/nickel transport system permease component
VILYILRRLVFLVVICFGVTLFTFLLSHVIPGDPARLVAGPGADKQQILAIRARFGLDKPLLPQYFDYLRSLFHGDLGTSIVTREPVTTDIRSRLPATLELVVVSFILYLGLGLSLSAWAATTRIRAVDVIVRVLSTIAFAVPAFVLALWLQILFFFHLGWLPSSGRLNVTTTPPPNVTGFYLIDSVIAGQWGTLEDSATHLVLPVAALMLGLLAIAVRLTRATILNELDKDYVKMLRLKGLSEGVIMRRHVMRNALVPSLALYGIQFGYLIGGTVVVETIFSWPGLGSYAFDSVAALDYAPVMGVTLVLTAIFVTVNIVIDLLYPLIDPRIRLWGQPA